jgi:antitoxin VapB
LPSEFRFEGTEVFIRRDPATEDVILLRRPESWDSFFELRQRGKVPSEFLARRQDEIPQQREMF